MSSSEEDSYSMIFASLKHPIRRKILRILSAGPQAFSDLQKEFNIESSHLTYHIGDLGNLLYKTEDGRYALSSLGKAAVSMMRNVEEPSATLNLSLPRRLGVIKIARRTTSIALGIICIVLAASLVGTFAYYSPLINGKNGTISSLNTLISEKTYALSSLDSLVSELIANVTSLQNQLDSLRSLVETRIPSYPEYNTDYVANKNYSYLEITPLTYTSPLEIMNVRFEIGHIYIELGNDFNRTVTIRALNITWVGDEYLNIPSWVQLPISIVGNSSTILDVSCDWVPGYYYQVMIDLSDGSAFSEDLGQAPTTIQGALLYKVNVNFYLLNGLPKIDLDIGNCGTEEATVTEFHISNSKNESMNLLAFPVTIQASERSRMTLGYNWTSDESYRLKVGYNGVRSLIWTQQSPSWRQDENPDPVILHFDSESIVVQKGDIFTANVSIENIPENYGCAGIQFKVTWDPSVLTALNMTEVMFHAMTPPEEQDNIWRNSHKISNQSVDYAYLWLDLNRAQAGGYAPIWGNHTLATITFKALDTGSATLHFSVVKMGDADAQHLIDSVDEPEAYGRNWTSLVNYVLLDCQINVDDAKADACASDN